MFPTQIEWLFQLSFIVKRDSKRDSEMPFGQCGPTILWSTCTSSKMVFGPQKAKAEYAKIVDQQKNLAKNIDQQKRHCKNCWSTKNLKKNGKMLINKKCSAKIVDQQKILAKNVDQQKLQNWIFNSSQKTCLHRGELSQNFSGTLNPKPLTFLFGSWISWKFDVGLYAKPWEFAMVGKLKKTNLTRVSKTTNLYLVHLGKKPLTPHLFFSTLVWSGRNLYVLKILYHRLQTIVYV